MTQNDDSNRSLNDALRALAREDDGYSASAAVEARLRAEVRTLARAQRANVTQVFAIAASLLLMVGAMTWVTTRVPVPTNRYEGPRADVAPIATDFLPLIHSQLSLAGTYIVRMELPRQSLVSFGLAPETFGGGGKVLADVVVGDDGLARAIRFVQPAR